MFIGHFGLGFGAKAAVPRVSLGTLFVAAQFADLLWPTLVLAGLERVDVAPGTTAVTPLDFISYPYSHSLLALAVWGVLFGLVYFLLVRSRTRAGVVLGVLVVSHWLLDAATHRPDMPLTIGGTARVGLGLWNSVPGTLAAELLIFAGGLALYRRATVARDKIGSIGLLAFAVFLLVVYAAAVFGPPPPSSRAVAWSAESMWLLVAWAFWVDRHRTPLRQ
jgi:membrane-bound metal-dependent hydrolase YbcI (DUF457 family)